MATNELVQRIRFELERESLTKFFGRQIVEISKDENHENYTNSLVLKLDNGDKYLITSDEDGRVRFLPEKPRCYKIEIGEAKLLKNSVPKDSVITCPKCKRALYFVTKDIIRGTIVTSDFFQPALNSPPLKNGQIPVCHSCSEPFIRVHAEGFGVQIHTDKGWTDNDDTLSDNEKWEVRKSFGSARVL